MKRKWQQMGQKPREEKCAKRVDIKEKNNKLNQVE
jgi:hypothetical protein